MFKASLEDIQKIVSGKVVGKKLERCKGIETDTRKKLDKRLFIALKGDRYDAHDFLQQAVEGGASIIIIDHLPDNYKVIKKQISVVLVKDTLVALQKLAHYWRKQLAAKIVAISGSNGKTTTKEYAAALLSQKYKTHWSEGSFNNHWGVPLSLLRASLKCEVLLQEVGMNHLGELTALNKIIEPDVTIITNVSNAHIGMLGSIENIMKAKFELYQSAPDSNKIFNLDNEYTKQMWEKLRQKENATITFSSDPKINADVSFQIKSFELASMVVQGCIAGVAGEAKVQIFGQHNVVNLMAASCIALECGMNPEEIWHGLDQCKNYWGRNQLLTMDSGTSIVFDAYNASPQSMSELLKNIESVEIKGKKILILGQMLELGNESKNLHCLLGEQVGALKVSKVLFIGKDAQSFEQGFLKYGNKDNLMISDTYKESLAFNLQPMLDSTDMVFIKGSRGMALENILEAWNVSI